MKNYKLIDNIKESQYEFHVDKYIPKIEYIRSKKSEIFFTHTEVPIPIRGQGMGTLLVKSALEDVDRKGLRLIPMCPFVTSYINENPEWERIVIRSSEY